MFPPHSHVATAVCSDLTEVPQRAHNPGPTWSDQHLGLGQSQGLVHFVWTGRGLSEHFSNTEHDLSYLAKMKKFVILLSQTRSSSRASVAMSSWPSCL